MILFSAKIANKHQDKVIANNPNLNFVFCESMAEAKHYIGQAEILVTYGEDLTDELIQKAEQLKWIMVISAGIEKMPFKAIQERGIIVTNVRGIHKIPMAEYAISMLLQVYRQAKSLQQKESSKQWDRVIHMQEITGKTMLIVGTGAIGQEVARLAKAFRMKTIGISKSGRPVEYFDENHPTEDMQKLLPQADFVVSVLPSTYETKGFFKYEHFQQLPNHSVFLNMGRGDVVRSEDILRAVQEQEISHAVLDVFEEEPLPADHAFWQEENITVTPHLSGISPNYLPRALEVFEQNLQTYVAGKRDFINQIDVTRGY